MICATFFDSEIHKYNFYISALLARIFTGLSLLVALTDYASLPYMKMDC